MKCWLIFASTEEAIKYKQILEEHSEILISTNPNHGNNHNKTVDTSYPQITMKTKKIQRLSLWNTFIAIFGYFPLKLSTTLTLFRIDNHAN